MVSKTDLLKHPNYLLSNYQLEIYSQLVNYMEENNLKKQDVAAKLGVSNSYVSQILNGESNFTLKKLIELGIMIGKVPYVEFVSPDEFWRREKDGIIQYVNTSTTYKITLSPPSIDEPIAIPDLNFIDYKGGVLPKSVTKTTELLAESIL